MSLHIITGLYKGRRLELPPKGSKTRPTNAKTRLAMFNILNRYIDFTGIRVADVCCGTGALGLEALSRGASFGVFVDPQTHTVQQNIQKLGLQAQTQVLAMDVRLLKLPTPVDLVLADPPYDLGLGQEVLNRAPAIGRPGTLWMLETEKGAPLDLAALPLEILDQRHYGNIQLTLLRQV